MDKPDPDSIFDAYYYAHGCEAPYERSPELLAFFERIAERIAVDIRPQTVLDAGCAMGFLVESLRRRGIEAYGIDISSFAIEQVHPDVRPFCWTGSIVEPFPRQYDLIVSIEVLEHMPKDEAEKTVVNFCQHSSDILFSSTPFDYKEVTHFNVQPPDHWGELFARQGFFRDVDFDASFITPWAARFRFKDEPVHRIIRSYERSFWQLYKENADLRKLALEMRAQLAKQGEGFSLEELTRIKNENDELRRLTLEMRAQPDKQRDAYSLEELSRTKAELAEIHKSSAWKMIQLLWRLRLFLAPAGSRRERLLLFIKRGGRKG